MLELHEIPFFSRLSPEDLVAIHGHLDRREFPAGTFLCRQGDEGRHFYAIASGGVDVLVPGRPSTFERVFLGPGRVLGEMSLLSDEPVSATVVAVRDTLAYALSKASFLHLLETRPVLYEGLVQMLVERLRHRFAQRALSPCLVLAHAVGNQPTEALVEALFERVRHYSPESVLVHSQDDPTETSSRPAPAPARAVSRWTSPWSGSANSCRRGGRTAAAIAIWCSAWMRSN
jgi:CRP-like cAMP-binding protein